MLNEMSVPKFSSLRLFPAFTISGSRCHNRDPGVVEIMRRRDVRPSIALPDDYLTSLELKGLVLEYICY
jgi:hypothetical protein